jgi:aminomuconate-semialdehyde/2-hydroxymuconate-6-semialdehyde dehydrogenase
MLQIENFINGQYQAGVDGKFFDKRSPVDNQLVARVAEGGAEDVHRAVEAAQAALHGEWGALSVEQRVCLLHALAAEIDRRADDFAAAEMADTGQPEHVMKHVFIPRGAANFRIFADIIKNVASEAFQMATPDGRGALSYSLRVPKGVVGVICPWNAPFMLMTWKVGPALACGNTVIVKPSEETPQTAALLGEVMNAVGIPKGVYNVVHGFGPGSAGEFITRHPRVNAITFTGETSTGTAIMQAAAEGVRDVSFELGGKNAGKVCLGTERVYVERPLFDRFVQALKERAEAVKPGRPDDHAANYGPLISLAHRQKVLGYYQSAIDDGATLITGGGVPDMPADLAEGAWVQPTIWTGLPETAAVVREEIFGPCCHVQPFDTEEEVLRLANDTPYGLSTTIWTSNLARAHRVAGRVNVGITWVNSWFLRDLRTPFGGMGQSGIGREGGVHSLEFYTETRNVCVKL